jgi:hypothetical protein
MSGNPKLVAVVVVLVILVAALVIWKCCGSKGKAPVGPPTPTAASAGGAPPSSPIGQGNPNAVPRSGTGGGHGTAR